MAEVITLGGQEYKKRGPWAIWFLSIVTFSIYYLVWHYKINDEARRYLQDESIKPGIALLALLPGAILVIPALVTVYRTGERIQRMEERTGIARTVEPIIGLIGSLFYSLHLPYFQSHLNTVWDTAVAAQYASVMPSQPAMVPPPPPPPPLS